MSEDLNKEHEATPFKLAEARKKGQVARSMEVSAFFGLLASLATLVAILGSSTFSVALGASWWLDNAHRLAQDNAFLWYCLGKYIGTLTEIVLSIILAGLLASIVAGIVHAGPVFSLSTISPDFSKLNPANGFKKIFSRKGLVDIFRLLLKVAAFVSVSFAILKYNAPHILTSNHATVQHFLNAWVKTLTNLIFGMLAVFFVFAVFDLWFSRREFSRQMRMSFREIKDEAKRREGDPEIKSKRKKILGELLNRAASTKNVKDSDVIITNPKHVAVALKFRASSMIAPQVVSKGTGLMAANIRRVARKNRIPIVRKPELARALLRKVRIGDTIHPDHQREVASVYRWIVTLNDNKVFK